MRRARSPKARPPRPATSPRAGRRSDGRTPVIDAHVHVIPSREYFSPRWLEQLLHHKRLELGDEGLRRWRARFERSNGGSVEALLADMDEAGVDMSVIFPSGPYNPFPGESFSDDAVWQANQYIAEAQRKYPDRIVGFVRPDVWKESAPQLVEEAITQWGLRGVKLHPVRLPLTDDRFRPLLDKIHELNVPVLVHQGVDPVPFLAETGNPLVLDNLTVRYPRIRFIAGHHATGFRELLTAVIGNRQGRIVSDLGLWQVDYARSRWNFILSLRHMMDMIPHAVLMASDWPWLDGAPLSHKGWFDAIRRLRLPRAALRLGLGLRDFSADEKEMLLGGNAARFLGLPPRLPGHVRGS